MHFDKLNVSDLISVADTLPNNNLINELNNKSQLNENQNFDLKFNSLSININNLSSSYDLLNVNQINYDNNLETEKNNNNATNNNFVLTNSLNLNATHLNQSELHIEPGTFRNETIILKDLNSKVSNESEYVRENSKNVLFLFFKKLVCILVGIPSKNNNASLSNKNGLIKQRPFIAFFVFGLTLILGILYAFFDIWFAITNGSSQATKNSILREFTSISVSLIWLLLGKILKTFSLFSSLCSKSHTKTLPKNTKISPKIFPKARPKTFRLLISFALYGRGEKW